MICSLPYTALPGSPPENQYIDGVFYCDGTTLLRYIGQEEIVRIPSGIETIRKSSFADSKARQLILPGSTVYIDELAFDEAYSLECVEDCAVREISARVFHDCRKLKKISFPHLEKYRDISFAGCDALNERDMLFPTNAVVLKSIRKRCLCIGGIRSMMQPLHRKLFPTRPHIRPQTESEHMETTDDEAYKSIVCRAKSNRNDYKALKKRIPTSSGPRGRWFKSSHSDQKEDLTRLILQLCRVFFVRFG